MPETNFSTGQVYIERGDDDNALVERTLAGDVAAFSSIVDRYQKIVYNVALRMVQDSDDAEDVAQDVFIKAYERLCSYDHHYKFFSWLYKIAVNESLNFIRKRKPTERMCEETMVASTQDEVEQGDAGRHIDEALKRLTADQRAVVVLRHFEGLGYDEIGKVLNITEKKVKSRLFSARQILRVLLEKRGVLQHDR
jgi:RNA polymerase sigma-70 factor (ECF subfamily)